MVLQDPNDVIELTMRDTELLKWGSDVLLDLGRLAWDTLCGPDPYLLLQAIPNHF